MWKVNNQGLESWMRETCEVLKHIQFIATSAREKWSIRRKSTMALHSLSPFIFSKQKPPPAPKQTNKTTTQ